MPCAQHRIAACCSAMHPQNACMVTRTCDMLHLMRPGSAFPRSCTCCASPGLCGQSAALGIMNHRHHASWCISGAHCTRMHARGALLGTMHHRHHTCGAPLAQTAPGCTPGAHCAQRMACAQRGRRCRQGARLRACSSFTVESRG